MSTVRIRLCTRVTCPHCWHTFPPEEILWVSQHPELRDDPKLPGDLRRFLPSRFNADGEALDARQYACHKLACPNCHLSVPRAFLEMDPFFLSILGSPGSGKSYFLTSMTWQLRQNLKSHFGLSFANADTEANGTLIDYENLLFHTRDRDKLVRIRKTEVGDNDHFDRVLLSGQSVTFPRPFLFSLRPDETHPNYGQASKMSRAICLYDNAGENFQRGTDSATNPVIRHMVHARVLFFLFDPTQDPRFRDACQGRTHDPQMREDARIDRQDSVLSVAADCIRQHKHLASHEKYDRPLVVIVTKYDAWSSLLGNHPLTFESLLHQGHGPLASLKLDYINDMSAAVRKILLRLSPEMVNMAEGFAKQVVYVPCSALGRGPEVEESTGGLCIRPKDIKPAWTEVPFIYALSRWVPGLVPYVRPKTEEEPSAIVKLRDDAAGDEGTEPASSRVWKKA